MRMSDIDKLVTDLRLLRATLPAPSVRPSIEQLIKIHQRVGEFILKDGCLDAIIDALENKP
jgi:hypothetical protein